MPAQTPNAVELRVLAGIRLTEAKALLQARLFDGCWYLAGYAVECALKAVICRTLGLPEYPDQIFRGSLKSHLIEELVQLAGLTPELTQRRTDAAFRNNWDLILTWDPQHRYQVGKTQQQADDIILALVDVQNGVLTWLSKRW